MDLPVIRIDKISALDLRFPTSRTLDGSDAMNPTPDYSAAYVTLHTNQPGLNGYGFTFTIGRGNQLCVAAIEALASFVEGYTLEEITSNMGAFCRALVGDSQIRWVGPEKGVVHLAAAAIINAVWDLWGRVENKPIWKLVADLAPEQVVSLIDFRHITDALAPAEALELLCDRRSGISEREAILREGGFPAYTTSAGWLGYPEDKIRRLSQQAVADGWQAIKIKVGRDKDDDIRRCAIIRDIIGPDRKLMIDANQVWEVDEAIEWVGALAQFDPYWIEEPLSPDDILGHAAVARAVRPIRMATGEHAHNRIMFKQFLQADAIDVVQLDACRLAGLNEAIAVMLLAAKFDKPICPHAGGVGLCENAQHVSMIDYLIAGASMDGRMTEHSGHLHEHFLDPIRINRGHYLVPEMPGFSAEIYPASVTSHAYPHGDVWTMVAE